MRRYLKPTTLVGLAKAWKMNDLPALPNKDRGRQLFLRVTSTGNTPKKAGCSYITEDDLTPEDIVIIGQKYFKLI